MKNINNLFVLVLICLLFCACSSNSKEGFVTVKGQFDVSYDRPVKLYQIEHAEEVEIASSVISNDKYVGFSFKPETEGFYVISDGVVRIPIYAKGNQDLQFSYSQKNGYHMQIDGLDEENKILSGFQEKLDTLQYYDSRYNRMINYKKFFPFYADYMPVLQDYHSQVNTSNEKFNKLMHAFIDISIEDFALRFIYTPKTINPKRKQMAEFYSDFMKSTLFDSSIAMYLPNGISTLKLHKTYELTMWNEKRPANVRAAVIQTIKNDTLKAYAALQTIEKYDHYSTSYMAFVDPLRDAISKVPYVEEKVALHESKIRSTNPGDQGYSFAYPDINGNEVSFESLRGKYVYVDLWATWCGPCKAQIPHLKKLEKKYHDKDIHFVSISLDKAKDKEKWEKYVHDNSLVGIQLLADKAFKSKVAQDYKVSAIPHFMLFDKNGVIIDANAKRPSDPRLDKQLANLLNK